MGFNCEHCHSKYFQSTKNALIVVHDPVLLHTSFHVLWESMLRQCILAQGMEAGDSKQRDSVDASQSKSRRSSMGSNLWHEGRNAFLRSQTSGVPAFSLVPLAKVSAINAEVSQKIFSLPAAPGATSLSAALAIVGMQVWLPLLMLWLLTSECGLHAHLSDQDQRDMPVLCGKHQVYFMLLLGGWGSHPESIRHICQHISPNLECCHIVHSKFRILL